MNQAVIFDLDGTLVQTERLKALSTARAVAELCPGAVSEAEGDDPTLLITAVRETVAQQTRY